MRRTFSRPTPPGENGQGLVELLLLIPAFLAALMAVGETACCSSLACWFTESLTLGLRGPSPEKSLKQARFHRESSMFPPPPAEDELSFRASRRLFSPFLPLRGKAYPGPQVEAQGGMATGKILGRSAFPWKSTAKGDGAPWRRKALWIPLLPHPEWGMKKEVEEIFLGGTTRAAGVGRVFASLGVDLLHLNLDAIPHAPPMEERDEQAQDRRTGRL